MRKQKLVFGIALIASLFTACSSEPKEAESAEESTEMTVDLEGLEEYPLEEYLMPGSIYLPTSMGKPKFNLTDWGSLEITIGERFGLEITPSGLSIEEKKTELGEDLVYTIEYKEETGSSIQYTKNIKEADIKSEHHFYRTIDIDGELISLQSHPEMSFSAGSIKNIIRSIKSYQ